MGQQQIQVKPGQTVKVWKVQFEWLGPATPIFVCWGLKKGTGSFNNGQNLVGGPTSFGSATITPFAVSAWAAQESGSIDASLVIPASTPPAVYDTYIWLSYQQSANELSFVQRDTGGGLLDTDAALINVVSAIPAVGQARMLNVGYAVIP